MDAEYRPYSSGGDTAEVLSDTNLQLREGHYLDCVATVGQFEHTLSTELLNHLVLVQKVFVKVGISVCVSGCVSVVDCVFHLCRLFIHLLIAPYRFLTIKFRY